MDKEQAWNEYKEALSVALTKRKQYTYLFFKEAVKGTRIKDDEVIEMVETSSRCWLSRMQCGGNFERDITYEELCK